MAKKRKTPEDQAKLDAVEALGSRDFHAEIEKLLKKGKLTITEIAEKVGLPPNLTKAIITDIQHGGKNIQVVGERITITSTMPRGTIAGAHVEMVSDDDGWIHFGATGDQHICSKYHRADILNELYDIYEANGITHVFNTGNWIDGEHTRAAPPHEVTAHGIEGQCEALASNYPQREGVTTYAVAGDDHEGWYQQREGVDIGRYAERVMREFGRNDWHHLGYQAAHVKLTHKKTGKSCVMLVEHPGGGSSYADSYAIQKIVEALSSGEKPAIGLFGHYHKLMAGNYRGVWYVQTGCCKDRDGFARKKKLRYDRGGAMISVQLDGNGAVRRFVPELFQWFDRGYQQHKYGLNPQRAKAVRNKG